MTTEHSRWVRAALAVLAMAGAAFTAGCGDDGPKTFTEQAQSVCERYDDRQKELPQAESPDDLAEVAAASRALFEEMRTDMVALDPPAEAAAASTWREFLDAMERGLRDLDRAGKASDPDDVQKAIADATPHFTEARTAAEQLDLTACID